MALLNSLMAINLFSGSFWLYAVIAIVAVALIVLIALVKVEVVYVDPETDYEIAHKKYGWGSKISLSGVRKTGKRFLGWSYDENGERRVTKKKIRLWKTTELYAVWEKPMVGITIDEANAALEFVYVDDRTGEQLVKDVCPLSINVPMEVGGEAILGWGLDPSQGPLVTASEHDKSVLTVELYPVREGWEQLAAEEEPAEEVAEEPVEEVAEPVEEVVEETPVEEPVEEAPVEEVAEPVVIEPTIVPTYIDGNGNELNIQYSRSFIANVIQSEDNVKEFYSELKNHILSYKGVKSRISWKFDSYNRGRDQLFKIKLRGKTICMYCALDPNEFDKAKYHHEAIDAKIFADVPMLVKIKSNLGLKKAKELVDFVMARFAIELNPKAKTVDYVAEHPYEETDALVQKGLIKILQADANDVKKAPAIVKEEAVEAEPEVVEVVEEAPVEEVAEPVVIEPTIVPTYIDGNGNELNIRYSRSMMANVIQAGETEKNFYSEIKNYILSYKGVKSRMSWKFDSFNKGRIQLFKIKLRGKTISMYCALDPNEFEKSRYHHEAVDAKMLADVPMLVKIKSNLGLKKAKELVDIVMAKFEIALDPKAKTVDYVAEHPYEETEALIQKGLIKVLQADENDVKKAPAIVEEEAVEAEPEVVEVVEEAPVVEEPVEEAIEEIVEEAVEETVEEIVEEAPVEETVEEVIEEAVEETVEEEVVEEPVEEAVEEPIEEAVEEEAIEEVVEETVEEVAEEAPVEETAEEVIEEAVEETVEETVEEIVEEAPVEETAEEVIEEAVEETVEEEVVEETIEEPAEETVEEAVEPEAEVFDEAIEEEIEEESAPATTVEDIQYVESVSADEVDDLVVDEVVDSLVEEDVEFVEKDDVKKAIVNIDTLSKAYNDGDVVDLASLKAKGLIDKKSKSVKILSRGVLDKALTVKASEFSETALKMIVLTGGKAVKTVSKVK